MKTKKASLTLILFCLAIASTCIVAKAQTPIENTTTFFEAEVPAKGTGLKIQVNATAETQPTKTANVTITIKALADVTLKSFNFSVYGMLYGKNKVCIYNVSGIDLPLSLSKEASKEYNYSFQVPENIWDVTYGEIVLSYSVLILSYEGIKCGFTMTHVENVYLKSLEEELQNLNSIFAQLNQTFYESFGMNLTANSLANLNETYWEYKKNYTEMQGTMNELSNTRMAVIVLAIITVIFVATTVYLIMRKPREYW